MGRGYIIFKYLQKCKQNQIQIFEVSIVKKKRAEASKCFATKTVIL